jgi:hypothetical protein
MTFTVAFWGVPTRAPREVGSAANYLRLLRSQLFFSIRKLLFPAFKKS